VGIIYEWISQKKKKQNFLQKKNTREEHDNTR
jgi:hypothetical protein